MSEVRGTTGYKEAIESFANASLALDFDDINHEFLPFIPKSTSKVIDLGSGVGQNSAALAKAGHQVIAIEPLLEFIHIAKANFTSTNITWINDSLPMLNSLIGCNGEFDFILVDGVWHHLSPQERIETIAQVSRLLTSNGTCAISLRSGPPGAGTHVFPTSIEEISELAEGNNAECTVLTHDTPSKMKNKPQVKWSRVIIRKKS